MFISTSAKLIAVTILGRIGLVNARNVTINISLIVTIFTSLIKRVLPVMKLFVS